MVEAQPADVLMTFELQRDTGSCCRRGQRRKQAEAGVKEALRPEPGADEDPYHALMLSNPTTGANGDKNAINSLG